MEERVQYLTKRLSHLKSERQPWEAPWDKAAELCSVNSKIYIKDDAGRIVMNTFDGTAKNARISCAAGLKSVLIPTNMMWHRVKPSNPALETNDNVRRYVEYARNMLFKYRYAPNSRFAAESWMHLLQLVTYGNAAWLVEDDIGRGIRYRSIPIRETYVALDSTGEVDTVYREYEMSARDALREFGNLATQEIRDTADKNPERKMRFLHAVEPRQDRDVRKKDFRGMPFVSYNVDLDNNKVIYEGGYRVNPYMFPHIMPIEGSPYGSSPALQAFQDILSINEMSKTMLRAGQLQVRPTIFVGNGIKDASKIGSPGAIVKGLDSNGKPLAAPLQIGGNPNLPLELMQRVTNIINESFMVSLFRKLTNINDLSAAKGVTAYAVQQMVQEAAALLAPTSELLSKEWLVGDIRREIDILSQYGIFDDVPDELMYDGSLAIEFESPAVHMQKATTISGLMEWLESVIGMSQVEPSVLDIVDLPRAGRLMADYKDVSTEVIRSPEAAAQLGQQRAQAQQAQALLQAAPVVSQTIKNLGGANVGVS